MQFIPILFIIIVVTFVVTFIVLISKFSEKTTTKLEQVIFLRGFEMIRDFELIQDWTISDFPVAIGRFLGSLCKVKLYIAIGRKNEKTYVIIKRATTTPLSLGVQYIFLEESSIESFKKIIESIEKNKFA